MAWNIKSIPKATCPHCREKYSLTRAVESADRKKTREVVCPNCGGKVAKSNG
jgi:DNA-directed RNA polymerase subunit RPC12/RpoP